MNEIRQAIMDWNSEVVRFINDRIKGDIETLGHVAQCKRPQDVFEIEADWFQTALDDYAKEATKLIEANRNFLSLFFWLIRLHASSD